MVERDLGERVAGVHPQIVADVGALPSGLGDRRRVLGADDHGAMPLAHRVVVREGAHRRADRVEDPLRVVGHVVGDAVRRLGGDHEDGGILRAEAFLHMVGSERARLLVLRDAVGVAAGPAEGRHADHARRRPADVDPAQAHRPADGRVRPPAGTENAGPRVDVERGADRAVHDHQRRDRIRRAGDAEQAEALVAHRLDRGDHHREILGAAACHHRVDRDFLHGGAAEAGRHHGDHLVGWAAHRLDGGGHAGGGRGYHG